MFLIESEKDLVNAFRPRDRKVLELPPAVTYPLFVRDYHAWLEPTGQRVFIVLQDPASERPLGIAFRRDPSGAGTSRLCEWCHSWGNGEEIGLLSTEKSSKRIVGIGLCLDLRCSDKIQQMSDLAGRSAVEPRKRMLERIQKFAREALGIGQVPAA
jgi:hypothetical protein